MTANRHHNTFNWANGGNPHGCLDSIKFKTSDNMEFGCDAREGTPYASENYPGAGSPRVLSDFNNELIQIYLSQTSDCMLTTVETFYKDCSNLSPDWIHLDLSSVGGKI